MTNILIRKFTDSLYELICCKNLSLQQSLQIMSEICVGNNDSNKIKKSASQILSLMSDGFSFSAALRECKFISFDMPYISFISYSEITGRLKEIIMFLKDRGDEKKENINCLISACVYPGLVMVLGFIIVLLVFYYRKNLFGFENGLISNEQIVNFFEGFLLFLIFSLLSFILLFKNLKDDKRYEAFLVVSFLLKSGMNMHGAFSYAALILGEESREGKIFIEARNRISMGMDLRSSFRCDEKKSLNIPGFETAIYFAQKGGSKSDVFEKIAISIRRNDLKKRKICLGLIEPLLIGLTGILIILLVINFVMPVVMNTGVIL